MVIWRGSVLDALHLRFIAHCGLPFLFFSGIFLGTCCALSKWQPKPKQGGKYCEYLTPIGTHVSRATCYGSGCAFFCCWLFGFLIGGARQLKSLPIPVDPVRILHLPFRMYVHVKYDVRFFLARCSPASRVFLLALSAAGQASLPWVHYKACLDLGRAPWRRSAH